MFHRGVCFERERIRGLGEIENFYEEESIYSHRRSVYIYLIKRKKIRFKNKKNADVKNCGVSRVFGFIYIYIYIDYILSLER